MMRNITTAFRNKYPAVIIAIVLMLSSVEANAQLRGGLFYNPIAPPYSWRYGWFKESFSIPIKIPTTGIDTGSVYYRLTDSSVVVWTGSQWKTFGGGGGATPNLQSVVAAGATSNNSFGFDDGSSNTVTLGNYAGSPAVRVYKISGSLSSFLFGDKLQFYNGVVTHNLLPVNYSNDRTWYLPDTTGNIAMAVKVNGTRYGANGNGLIDLGTVGGGTTNTDSVAANLRSGTYAQRIQLAATAGKVFYQTDGKEGNYIHNGQAWSYYPSAEQVLHNIEVTSTLQIGSVMTVDNSGTGSAAGSFSDYVSDSGAIAGSYPLRVQAANSQARMYANYPDATGGFNRGQIYYREYVVRLSHVSDGTDNFFVYVGHIDTAAIDHTGFLYSPDYGNQWVVYNKNTSSVVTRILTGITVSTTSYQVLGIKRYGNDSSQYFINDVYVGTIENANTEVNSFGTIIRKTAGSNNRFIYFDRISYYLLRRRP